MITRLELINYRCYDNHEVFFKPTTIIVGKNNAGKSTLIEALRLVSLVANKIKTSHFKAPPKWTNLSKAFTGISPSLERIEFSIQHIIHQYNDPPATIIAHFLNKETIEIRINDDGDFFAFVKNKKGNIVTSRSVARGLENANIEILPQISPLLKDEKALEESYVKSNIFSTLTSRHFRNQLSYLYSYFEKFKELSESTWEGLRIVELTQSSKTINIVDPTLLVQEGGFATEIGSMGHGLQMWLQTMWFIARTSNQSSIVLDEPDVYMHADLQRKLIRKLRGNYQQIIIATHSLEIMAEVDAENILLIDRRKRKSEFTADLPSIQKVIYNDIGSIHNLGLAKLWSSRKFIMVEGDDISILKRFQNTILPLSNSPIDSIPNSDIGGWGGWKYAIGSKYVLRNAGGQALKIYCILDSDYHLPPDKEHRLKEGKKFGINLHIWNKKEIENYLIIPSTILRLVISKKPKLHGILTSEILNLKIDEFCEDLKEDIINDYASEIGKYFRRKNKIIDFTNNNKEIKYEIKNINRVAKRYVKDRWENKLDIVPGKKLIKEINKWLSEDYKVNIGTLELAKNLKEDEIHSEIKIIINKIENLK